MAESGQQSAFISIYHKRVPVTAEMKIELHRMNSTLRAKMRKERRCAQKDYLQCCGDCLSCYWRRNGIYVSLDSRLIITNRRMMMKLIKRCAGLMCWLVLMT